MLTCNNVTDRKSVYPFPATSIILMNPVIGDNKAQALAQICPQPFEGKHVQEFKDAQAWDVIRKEQADFWVPPWMMGSYDSVYLRKVVKLVTLGKIELLGSSTWDPHFSNVHGVTPFHPQTLLMPHQITCMPKLQSRGNKVKGLASPPRVLHHLKWQRSIRCSKLQFK